MNTLDLQRSLYRLGYDVGGCDGIMGPKTQDAVAAFSADHNDCSDSTIIAVLTNVPPFIEAKNYSRANRVDLGVIVIHTAEAPEIHREARNVAGWFAMQPRDGELVNGKKFEGSSAHYVVDDAEVIQSVLELDMAWHAGSGNGHSIGIEHAGYAAQTPEQWDDDYSRAVLANSAKLVARLCKRFHIPIVHLTSAELVAGARGLVGHCDVNDAFGKPGTGHRDPGPSFPWEAYLEAIRAAS